MALREILLGGTGGVLLLLTLIQVSPIKIDPWTAFAKWLGRAFNSEVLAELEGVKQEQLQTRSSLDEHMKRDEQERVDERRARILRFNNELIRNIPHTREEFIEVLSDIDIYERYCDKHKDYENGRAVHAIGNINRVYDERLKKHDFI